MYVNHLPFVLSNIYTKLLLLIFDLYIPCINFQGLLQSRAEKHINWLEEWWLNTAYLEYRDPVVVFSSPGLVFPFRKFPTQEDQLKYAAKTLLAALEYKALIDG